MKPSPPKPIWAYTYQIVPPQPVAKLKHLKGVLEAEHADATLRSDKWEGRLVADDRITHLLVLSDSADLDRDVNRKIESELRALDARFSVTVPLAVVPGVPTPPAKPDDNGQ
jgi:hypothetical protein